MSKLMENVAILNSTIRTMLGVALVGGLGVGGWYGYTTYHSKDLAIAQKDEELASVRGELEQKVVLLQEKDLAIESLNVEVQRQQQEIERLDTAMRLLKVDHRVGRLTVLDQATDPDGNVVTRIQFQELDDQGQPVDTAKQFTIPGDVVYVDSWVVKFDDKYIESADLHRSTSLVLFRRIFGEQQKPLEGAVLDEAGGRPKIYGRGGGPMSEFERKIWGDFWSVANDEARQHELGIRAAHGEAPSIKVHKGKSYRVELRASAGLTITPEGDAPPAGQPSA